MKLLKLTLIALSSNTWPCYCRFIRTYLLSGDHPLDRRSGETIRIPVHMIETINKIVRTSRQMLHEIGREPTPEELAEKLAMPLEKVRKVLKIAKEPISLETPIGDEEDSHLGDFIEDKNAILPIDAAIQSNLRETTTRVLASLTPREERVLRMRFGIGMNTDHTLEEVGQQFSRDPRAHPPDRGQGAAQAEAPEPVEEAAKLPRQLGQAPSARGVDQDHHAAGQPVDRPGRQDRPRGLSEPYRASALGEQRLARVRCGERGAAVDRGLDQRGQSSHDEDLFLPRAVFRPQELRVDGDHEQPRLGVHQASGQRLTEHDEMAPISRLRLQPLDDDCAAQESVSDPGHIGGAGRHHDAG